MEEGRSISPSSRREEQCEESNSSKDSGEEDSESSPVLVGAGPPSGSLTFNSHVLVNVEEFIYFSVRLGIKFQLLNNNIVVGPYYDDEVPPYVAAAIDALRSKSNPEEVVKAQRALQICEAVEKEEDFATSHTLTREDFHVIRRQAEPDDVFYCKGLLTANSKNTLLTYPPLKSHSKKKRSGSLSIKNDVKPHLKKKTSLKSIVEIGQIEKALPLSRNGKINWETIQHLTFNESGHLQEAAEDEKKRSRPMIQGVKPAKNTTADSFHINKKKLGGTSNPLDLESPTNSKQSVNTLSSTIDTVKEGNDDVVDESQFSATTKTTSDQEASWADEQSAEVMTYYINASSVAPTPVSSSNSSIHLPEATATVTPLPHNSPGSTTQVGFDPRSPSLSSTSRSPAAYNQPSNSSLPLPPVTIHATPVNVVVTDNVPYDRPPSLSVQQEFMLRNGSIRNTPSANTLSKASLRTGVEPMAQGEIHAVDLTSDMSHANCSDQEEDVINEEKRGKSVPCKIVVQSHKHFGENIKKVWKCDIPVELSEESMQLMVDSSPIRRDLGSSMQSHLIVEKITDMLVEKFSFSAPYLENAEDLIKEAGFDIDNNNSEVKYMIEEVVGATDTKNVAEENITNMTVMENFEVVSDVILHKMLVLYFDEDVDDFVSLDVDTLEDFTNQSKKALRVDYTEAKANIVKRTKIPVPVVTEEDGGGEKSITECKDEHKPDTLCPAVKTLACDDATISTVIPVSSDLTEWSIDDKKAEISPYGHWQWLTRRNISNEDGNFNDGAYLDSTVDNCLEHYFVGPQQWSTLVSVNGIRMKDLEKSLVFSMLKQRQRPLVLEFESRHGDAANLHGPRISASTNNGDGQGKQDIHLPASTFLAKYSHPVAKSLRKQVEKLLKNFDEYEWALSGSPGEASSGSSPQGFVTSLYRSIESELENLGLFDSSTPQGGGVPVMMESHWEDVRMHIETLVFNSIYDHVRAMAPVGDVFELSSHPVSGAPDQRSMVPLQTKFSFLSFLTLRDMGMDLPEGILSPCQYTLSKVSSFMKDSCFGNATSLPEEWRLGIKELCRATEMRSPLKIMQRLRFAVMLLTHAIEGLMGRPLKYVNEDSAEKARKEANEIYNQMRLSHKSVDMCDQSVIRREFIRPAGFYNPVTLGADELMPVLSWAIIQAGPPALDMAVWLCGEFRHPSNHMGECAYTLTQVSSALEFVKAATWKDFDISEEKFLAGVQRYELTQDLIVACKQGTGRGDVEKLRALLQKGADVNGLSVDRSDSPLSAAVKSKHVDVVKILLETSSIDVNMRISPYFSNFVNSDNELSSRAKESNSNGNKSKGSTKKETTKKDMLQDYTALMVAAFTGQVSMVALLLDKGANRYLVNEAGDTAAALARTGGHREVIRVLMADPTQFSLIDLIAVEDLFLLRGLLRQESVNVNESGIICKYRTIEIGSNAEETPGVLVEICGTPIHSSVYFRDANITNIILNSHRVDVNQQNAHGETALMWCGARNSLKDMQYTVDNSGCIIITHNNLSDDQKFQKEEDENQNSTKNISPELWDIETAEDISRVQMACSLLKEQADRYAVDIHGRTAYHWAKYGNRIAAPLLPEHNPPSQDEVPLEELPFVVTKCCYPRLAAVLYYDPSKYKIYHLARDGCIAGVRALLDQGVSINDSCPDGWYTPLIAAVYNKDITMARFLLQFSSIEVNFKGKHQTTALHYAAQEGCLSICGLLLFHNADRTALTTTGLLPIDFALSKGHKDIAACLRFDPQKVSICLAAKHGDMNVFAALINQGVSVNSKLRHVSEKGTHHELTTPLIAAVAFGQLEFIRQLMAKKEAILAHAYIYSNIMKSSKASGEDIDINATNFIGQTALMYAAASGDEDMTLYLLKIGAKRHIIDKEGRTAAKWAKQTNNPQLYMVLICDPARSSVHEAIREGNMDATIAFFKQEPNPNVRYFSSLSTDTGESAPSSQKLDNATDVDGGVILDGECPIIVAAKYGRLPIIRLLLRAPEIEIDNVDTFGKTALMHACEQGHENVVLLLLKHKSNRTAMCYSQKRAIDYAAASNYTDIVDILDADPYRVHIQDAAERGNARHVNALLKQGCPPNYKDERTGKRNRTALMCAASKGRLNVVKLLLSLSTSHSININLQDADGMTALMHAAKIGNLEVTGALLTADCKRDIVDARGKTAQNHASSHGFITGTQFKAQLMWR